MNNKKNTNFSSQKLQAETAIDKWGGNNHLITPKNRISAFTKFSLVKKQVKNFYGTKPLSKNDMAGGLPGTA